MGMFDYVEVEISLPGLPNAPMLVFQTKSLNNLMDTYVIQADKYLWRKSSVWMVDMAISYEEAPYDPYPLTGEIVFYTGVSKESEDDGKVHSIWYEYTAIFAGGKLVAIELLEPKELGAVIAFDDLDGNLLIGEIGI